MTLSCSRPCDGLSSTLKENPKLLSRPIKCHIKLRRPLRSHPWSLIRHDYCCYTQSSLNFLVHSKHVIQALFPHCLSLMVFLLCSLMLFRLFANSTSSERLFLILITLYPVLYIAILYILHSSAPFVITPLFVYQYALLPQLEFIPTGGRMLWILLTAIPSI